ncbi:MAG: ISL3 family transposase [Kiritimatiellales bacterium]
MPERKIEFVGPHIKIHSMTGKGPVVIKAEYTGPVECPRCSSGQLRMKDRIERKVRHASIGVENTWLHLTVRKYHCRNCGRYFRARVPGLLPYRRSTEMFRREIFAHHRDGISQQQLHQSRKIGSATVERWFHDFLERKEKMFSSRNCPTVLGIDEHFFSRKAGYVTTFCDLQRHRIFELAKGRSEKALHRALMHMKGRERVQVVCIDLSSSYRHLVRQYFPNAKIVSDRFHVIRLVLQHFLETWKALDPEGRKNRGLLSLMRRKAGNLNPEQKERLGRYFKQNPALRIIYDAKEELCVLLNKKHQTKNACRPLAKQLMNWIEQLQESPFEAFRTLGRTLNSWRNEIARMWRFTKNNGITEGFHTKMEMIQRRAYGFRNFNNYRLRVIVLCG